MESFTNSQLGHMIKEGFIEVHKRQDIANGRTKKLENCWSFMRGMGLVLVLLVVPLFINFIDNVIEDDSNDKIVEELVRLQLVSENVLIQYADENN